MPRGFDLNRDAHQDAIINNLDGKISVKSQKCQMGDIIRMKRIMCREKET